MAEYRRDSSNTDRCRDSGLQEREHFIPFLERVLVGNWVRSKSDEYGTSMEENSEFLVSKSNMDNCIEYRL
jgi:hypothetical protein